MKTKVAEKLVKFKYAIDAAVIMAGIRFSQMTVWAGPKETEDPFAFIQNGPAEGKDIFKGITDTAKNAGASGYKLGIVVGIIALVVAVFGVCFKLMSGNSTKKQEGKDHVIYIVLAGIGIFGVFSIIKAIADMGGSI